MLDTEDSPSASAGGDAAVPERTSFPDGRMTAKEAWNYCRTLCQAEEIESPTLRTFKWYLRHGNEIPSEMLPDPFEPDPTSQVHAVAAGAVRDFVQRLKKKGIHAMTVDVVGRKETATVSSKKTSERQARPAQRRRGRRPARELDSKEALAYLRRRVGKDCELNHTTFGFYLAYNLIKSRFEGRQRLVEQEELDAFLKLAPDGVYANQLDYETEFDPGRGDLTMHEAYAYYSEVDPSPIAMNSFRSLVAAGIVQPIRTANGPRAPVLGFRRQEISAFLAMRQRILEENRESPTTKSFLTRKAAETKIESPSEVARAIEDALARNRPRLEAAQAKAKKPQAKAKKPETDEKKTRRRTRGREAPNIPERRDLTKGPFETEEGRWTTVVEAYAYYSERVEKPLSLSWFRAKAYEGKLFRSRLEVDERPTNPKGKIYKVDLDSLGAYLHQARKTKKPSRRPAKPRRPQGWPVEKAYHKFKETLPPGLSLVQFKQLVRDELIKSKTRGDVVHVTEEAVRTYFGGDADLDRGRRMQLGSAYTYYCSRCDDPVAKSRFARWTQTDVIPGAEKNGDGLWTLSVEDIDKFLAEHPTGRIRPNRNSRVASDGRRSSRKTPRRPARKKATLKEPTKTGPPQPERARGHVMISMSSYSSPTEMEKALRLLTKQGFEVEVKP